MHRLDPIVNEAADRIREAKFTPGVLERFQQIQCEVEVVRGAMGLDNLDLSLTRDVQHGITLDLKPQSSEKMTMDERIQDVLTVLLAKKDLLTWSASDIFSTPRANHKHAFMRDFGCEHGIRWSLILERIPKPIAERFIYRAENPKLFAAYPAEQELWIEGQRRYLQRRLESLLKRENPTNFDRQWIIDKDPELIRSMRTFMKHNPGVTLYRFVKGVGGGWTAKFLCRFVKKDESQLKGEDLEDYLEQKARYIKRRTGELQARLKTLLDKKKPESFTPGWVQYDPEAKKLQLQPEIRKLMDFDPSITWFSLVEGIGEGWIDKFDAKCASLADYAAKWRLIVNKSGAERWSISWMRTEHSSLYNNVRRRLRLDSPDNPAWGNFFDLLQDDVADKYDGSKDGAEGRDNRRKERKIVKIKSVAGRINAFVEASSGVQWNMNSLAEQDPDSYRASRSGISPVGIIKCLPCLSELALAAYKSNDPFMKHVVLAEKVRRDLGDGFANGWKVTSIKSTTLRKEIMELGDKVEIMIKYLPDEVRWAFVKDINARNITRHRVARVLEEGRDDAGTIDKILQRNEYRKADDITYNLLAELRAEISRGNGYAVVIAESILEAYLSFAGIHKITRRGSLVEILFAIEQEDDLHMEIIRTVRCLDTRGDTVSLDEPLYDDENDGPTRLDRMASAQ